MITPVPSRKLEEIFNDSQDVVKRSIMPYVTDIQLTEGCDEDCIFDCGLDAIKGVREYTPPDILKRLFKTYAEEFRMNPKGTKRSKRSRFGPIKNKRISLYFASEPFNYNFEGHTFVDIYKNFMQEVGIPSFVSTAVPRGQENTIIDLLLGINLEKVIEEERCVERIFEGYDTNVKTKDDQRKLFLLIERGFKQIGNEYKQTLKDIASMVKDKNLIRRKRWLTEFASSTFAAEYWRYWNNCEIINRVTINPFNYVRVKKAFESRFPNLEPKQQIKTKYTLTPPRKKYFLLYDNIKNMPEILEKLRIDNSFQISFRPFYRESGRIDSTLKEGELYIMEIPGKRFIASPNKPVDFLDMIASLNTECIEDKYRYLISSPKVEGRRIERLTLGPKNIHRLPKIGILYSQGIVITPNKIFFVKDRKPSEKHPYGFEKIMNLK